MVELSLEDTIAKINHLIDSGDGDPGRLYYILESIQSHKHLYKSDRLYLEHKLQSKFQTTPSSPPRIDPVLTKIEYLINSDVGDPSRLQHIHDSISRGRYLYHSDREYLDLMLKKTPDSLPLSNSNKKQSETMKILDRQLSETTSKVTKLEDQIQKTKFEQMHDKPRTNDLKLRGTMPKDWSPPNETVLTGIYEQIKTEEAKIEEQKKLHDTISLQQSKLTQLILNRQDYERQVSIEKAKLEAQIKEEQEKVANQTSLSEQLHYQQSELKKVKEEREQILQKIQKEKEKISGELANQKNALLQVQQEQDIVETKLQHEQQSLKKLAEKQKQRLEEQSKLAKIISEQQSDLEYTKKQFAEIVLTVSTEKKKLIEEKKIKQSIKTKEKLLEKSKQKRLEIVKEIETAQKNILQKMNDEKSQIQKQSELIKDLDIQRKEYELLKKERETIESEILKEKQRLSRDKAKLKKQISDKSIKLKKIKDSHKQ